MESDPNVIATLKRIEQRLAAIEQDLKTIKDSQLDVTDPLTAFHASGIPQQLDEIKNLILHGDESD